MFCTGCGRELSDNEKFCKACGVKRFDFSVESMPIYTDQIYTDDVDEDSTLDQENSVGDNSLEENSANVNLVNEKELETKGKKTKKKGHKGLIAIICILLVILILAAGLVAYMYFNNYVLDFDKLSSFQNPFVEKVTENGDETDSDVADDENADDVISFEDEDVQDDGTDLEEVEAGEDNQNEESKEEEKEESIEEETVIEDAKSKWAEDERGIFFEASDKMPLGIDNKILNMNVDDLALYTGIEFASKDNYPDSEDIYIYRFPKMDTEVDGISIDKSSYVIADSEGKVCGLHLEYIHADEKDVDAVQKNGESIVTAIGKDAYSIREYLYFTDYPFISLSRWEGKEYYLNADNDSLTLVSKAMYSDDQNNSLKEDFIKEEIDIDSRIDSYEKADKADSIKVDIEKECSKIDKEKNGIEGSLYDLKYYDNDNGLVAWYLKNKTPVYVQCKTGYSDIKYNRIYVGNSISFVYVNEDDGGVYEYYFANEKLIRVVDPRGNVHDYGSKQWSRYQSIGDELAYERKVLSGTIGYYHQVLGY